MSTHSTQRLGDNIEIYCPPSTRGPILHAVLDFDGTLSLIRAGWQEVMLNQCIAELEKTPTPTNRDNLFQICNEFITKLTGRQTIYQMTRLAEEVARHGGTPLDPLEYKWQYLRLLQEKIAHRIAALEQGAAKDPYCIRGARQLLDGLARRNIVCYLASGTDEHFVIAEAKLLGLDHYFGEHIYGAQDDHQSFSKRMLFERICTEHDLHGSELVVFGDGYVEIENARALDAVAIGVASLEDGATGWDLWKKDRLRAAGAQILVPDWQESTLLLSLLCGEFDD